MSKELSPKQEEALQRIRAFVKERGYPPTVRELAALMGLSSIATVHGHLARLQDKGYISMGPGARTIRIHQVAVPAGS